MDSDEPATATRTAAITLLRRAISSRDPLTSTVQPTTPAVHLERTASLLARSIAMAKLTGQALPTPPPSANGHIPLGVAPSLETLQTRHLLRRNHTVTGVGRSSEGVSTGERMEARANLMRKLSERRLVVPRVAGPDEEREVIGVVGPRGRARPRSGSVGSWTSGIPLVDPPPPPSFDDQFHRYGERSATPHSVRSSGGAWAEERDRQSKLARMNGENAWEFEGHRPEHNPWPTKIIPATPVAEGRRQSSSASLSPPTSPSFPAGKASIDGLGFDLGGVAANRNALRRGSIPKHLLSGGVVSERRGGPASFGIGAVEEIEIRRRGSSASSSVALSGVRGRRDSTADKIELGKPNIPRILSDEAGSPLDHSEVESGSEDKWTLKERRLVAKVERKREAGLARSKEGAFPPPEEGYQFPSPSSPSSPQSSEIPPQLWVQETPSGLPHSSYAPSDVVSPYSTSSLFLHSIFSSSPSSSPSLRTKQPAAPDSTFFTPAYVPLSLPRNFSQSPFDSLLAEPLSPTSIVPPAPPVQPPPLESRALENDPSADAKPLQTPPPVDVLHGTLSPDILATQSPAVTSGTASAQSTIMARFPSSEEYELAHSSNYSPPNANEMHRELSQSSSEADFEPRKIDQLPAHQLPAAKIIAKLDSILGTDELVSSTPSVLDHPPRKLLYHCPVFQVVNVTTVKDRHLFLFSDLLLIAKPLIDDDEQTGHPIPSTLESFFVVKSIVEFKELKVIAGADPPDEYTTKKRQPPNLGNFAERFANEPNKAIQSLIKGGYLTPDPYQIASFLSGKPELNRNQIGAFLAAPRNAHILKAYVDRFRLQAVRIDDALRILIMSIRLPNSLPAAAHVLEIIAKSWTEANASSGFDPTLTVSLVLAIMRLSDMLHSGEGNRGLFSAANPNISVDDFIASFREQDPRLLVPESLLTTIWASIRKDRIEQASDNAEFSMTPDIQVDVHPSHIDTGLTYRVPSEPITITIPEPDPKFTIKLNGNDLKFDPPSLNFSKSATQTFRVTGTALGIKTMVMIKLGANAPRYQGLPRSKNFTIERAFMKHTFQISFINHLDVKRKYMFSTLDANVRSNVLNLIHDHMTIGLNKPPAMTRGIAAGEAIAVQVLRDALIVPEPVVPLTVATSPRPHPPTPRFGALPSPPALPVRLGRLGTPTKSSPGALARSNSFSKTYAAGAGKVETDLVAERDRTAAASNLGRNKDDSAPPPPEFIKSGEDIRLITEQNSLLPLVLSFLHVGAQVAPNPVSIHGTAFQLPPLASHTA